MLTAKPFRGVLIAAVVLAMFIPTLLSAAEPNALPKETKRNATSGWLGFAMPASGCLFTGESTPCPPEPGTASGSTASASGS